MTTMNGPTLGGYSFYLNVVVINTNASDAEAAHSEDFASSDIEKEEKEDPVEIPKESSPDAGTPEEPSEEAAPPASSESPNSKASPNNGEVVAVGEVRTIDDPKLKLLKDSKKLMDFAFNRKRSPKAAPATNAKAKDGRNFISAIGNSISKSSSNISKSAKRYVASKTMVSRAEKAVSECIPLVTEEIGVDFSISKRFQQGSVFVLEVDMKGCGILDLIKKVQGDEAARHYAYVKEGLEFLEMPKAQEAFLQEMLPKLRKAMMEKLSELVPEKMKMNKAYADLEIQCVALEDAEEAKWLYTFLSFMEEMK